MGAFPFAKLAPAVSENDENDPFVRACALAAKGEHWTHAAQRHLREMRRLNNAKFTFQVCLVALLGAFVASFFSGFTWCVLVLLVAFAAGPIVAKDLHTVAYTQAKPYIDLVKEKVGLAKAKVSEAAAKVDAAASSSTSSASNKKTD